MDRRVEDAQEARRLYEKAIDAERRGDKQSSILLNGKALVFDDMASPRDWQLLRMAPRAFFARKTLFRLISVAAPAISRRVLKRVAESKTDAAYNTDTSRIFFYWGQGKQNLPPVVSACLKNTIRLHDEKRVIFLDDTNVEEWIQLPPSSAKVHSISMPAYSDILRFELLAKYGGIWLDATCMPTEGIHNVLPRLLEGSGFFAFDVRKGYPGQISNWFLAAEPNHYITLMCCEALALYWSIFDEPIDYFFMHMIFECLYANDSEFQRLWNATSRIDDDPRAIGSILGNPHEAEKLDEVLGRSFVHKLTHKLKPQDNKTYRVIDALVDL